MLLKKVVCNFSKNTPAYLEQIKGIEMYGLLEHGYKIKMIKTDNISISVDMHADLKRI